MSAHTKVSPFAAHERPNALCAVCLLRTRIGGAKMVRATHDVVHAGIGRHMACDAHAERARRWGRIEEASAAYRAAAGGAR